MLKVFYPIERVQIFLKIGSHVPTLLIVSYGNLGYIKLHQEEFICVWFFLLPCSCFYYKAASEAEIWMPTKNSAVCCHL